ncbi:MAG TPA: kelch repeat-containing protein, partial [Clostridia bacterium]|nr:kelch repeat-containing protein [Clostridia bacterium]
GDGATYNPGTDGWEPLSGANAPAARFHHVALWTGQEMLIVAGCNGSKEFATGSAYDPLTHMWRPLSTSGNPQPRAETAAAWTGTELLVFGGLANGQPMAAFQRLIPQPVWYFYRKL